MNPHAAISQPPEAGFARKISNLARNSEKAE
jgi:hypothetical protein